jgi:hypothetical protein
MKYRIVPIFLSRFLRFYLRSGQITWSAARTARALRPRCQFFQWSRELKWHKEKKRPASSSIGGGSLPYLARYWAANLSLSSGWWMNH